MALASVTTTCVNSATALITYGVPFRTDKGAEATPGWKWQHIKLTRGTPGAPDPRLWLDRLADGSIRTADPQNPSLDVFDVCEIHDRLCETLKTGRPFRLRIDLPACGGVLIPGTQRITPKPAEEFVTGDLKIVCILIRLGCPLIKIVGTRPACKFHLAAPGLPLDEHGTRITSAIKLVTEFRNHDNQEPRTGNREHSPLMQRFTALMLGLRNRERLLDAILRRVSTIMIQEPTSGRSSLVPENADNRTLDLVARHLRIR